MTQPEKTFSKPLIYIFQTQTFFLERLCKTVHWWCCGDDRSQNRLAKFCKERNKQWYCFNTLYYSSRKLAAKRLSPDLNKVLTSVVKAVDCIRSNALNSRLFALLWEDMGSIQFNLLLHTEVRWLSRDRVLARFHKFREEICMYLDEKKKPDLAKTLCDGEFMA